MKSNQPSAAVRVALPGDGWMTFDNAPNPRLKAYAERQKKSLPTPASTVTSSPVAPASGSKIGVE